jgi:hypothetical protein
MWGFTPVSTDATLFGNKGAKLTIGTLQITHLTHGIQIVLYVGAVQIRPHFGRLYKNIGNLLKKKNFFFFFFFVLLFVDEN